MNQSLNHNLRLFFVLPFLMAVASAQGVSSGQATGAPVSYASANQVNMLLSQLDQTRQAMLADLAALKVDKWKADSGNKREMQSNVESIQRNLQSALPEMIGQLKASPENLTSTFKVYRNLSALYDVFASIAESAGAFGSKDEYQALGNDLSALDRSRRAFADRMETLAGAKEAELARLHSQIQATQAAPPSPPKKIIVDDTQPEKKPIKKKPVATTNKPPASSASSNPTK